MATAIECTSNDTDSIDIADETFLKIPLLQNSIANSNGIGSIVNLTGYDTEILTLPPGKEFHLFVSHSEDDVEEVNDLREELRKRFGLRCVNYEQDFIGGRRLEENIRICMRKSKNILVILTPSYHKSPWCQAELSESLELAVRQTECTIIPVLLRPTNIPCLLKPFRCIDKSITPDVAEKIAEAYHLSASGEDQETLTKEDILNQNGARVLIKPAFKLLPFWTKGHSFRFRPMSTTDIETLESNHLKCGDQYEAIRQLVNRTGLLRRYRVFSGRRYRCLVATVLAVVLLMTYCVGNAMEVLIRKQSVFLNDIFSVISAIILPSITWFLSYLSIQRIHLKLVERLRRAIWNENAAFFEKTKCLIDIDVSIVTEPCLCVIRYDIQPCQDFLSVLLDRKFHDKGQEAKETFIRRLLSIQLEDMQIKGQLCNWYSLPTLFPHEVNYHNTWMKRRCLCHMIRANGIVEV